jgi:hypothetical protein
MKASTPIPPEPWWLRLKVNIPEQTRGEWRIVHQQCDMFLPAKAVNAQKDCGRPLPPMWPGRYTSLQKYEKWTVEGISPDPEWDPPTYGREGWKTWMSDAPGEIFDQIEAIKRLRGRVLIGGLGLGVMVKAALERRDVSSVEVLEIDADIITMIGPNYTADPRLRIIHTDAMEWKPGSTDHWNVVWMDIWRDVTAANLPSMIELRRTYVDRGHCKWYGAWCEEYCWAALEREGHHDLKKQLRAAVEGLYA